jgi:hypothetical protein
MKNIEEMMGQQNQFESILLKDVPKGREGKHKAITTKLLADIVQLPKGSVLKIEISQLPDTKQKIRSALSRAANQRQLSIATSSDEEFLYVWKTDEADRRSVGRNAGRK